MMKEIQFTMNPGWVRVLEDLKIDVSEVLQRAALPLDLFSRKDSGLNTDAYFRFWQALEVVFNDHAFPLHLVRTISSEAFDPPIFAAYCSPNLNTALKRLSQFKPLIGPMRLDLEIEENHTRLAIHFLEEGLDIPISLTGAELSFFVQLARIATREELVPLRVTAPCDLPSVSAYTEFFGVTPERGSEVSLTFTSADANKPFISANEHMWSYFEPGLRKRLSEIQVEEGMRERVRSALLELLPSGRTTVNDLADKLMVGRRTLQRRLTEEGTNFKDLLTSVRRDLAKHYISKSELPYPQISFLLGYEDPNSFFRAFRSWTGQTPDAIRAQVRG
jgi:AraC-like DNA-binding protein